MQAVHRQTFDAFIRAVHFGQTLMSQARARGIVLAV